MAAMTEPGHAPTGRTLGVEPQPRALLCWDGPDHDRIFETLALHAPTIQEIGGLYEVRQTDYDLLVTNQMERLMGPSAARQVPARRLCLISFPPAGANDLTTVDAWAGRLEVRLRLRYLAKSIEVPDGLLDAVRDLVTDDLVPVALARPAHPYFEVADFRPGGEPKEPPPEMRPFLLTTPPSPRPLAGWYPRSPRSEAWVLPNDLRRPWDWVAAAIRHWAVTYGRFPLVGGWWEQPSWQTLAEAAAAVRQTELRDELAEATARLEAEIGAATGALHDARRRAMSGLRRLLTEKGDPLKAAAAEALTQLGYNVVDRDEEDQLADKGGKVEDLGATDPDDASVDPIIEVKGYDAGAKASDLALMLRHLSRADRAGRSPSAIWWVANHWRKRPPDVRGVILAGEDAMITTQAGEDVPLVVIDTRDLFRAVRAVEDGRVTSPEVRASLRAARGRWEGSPAKPRGR